MDKRTYALASALALLALAPEAGIAAGKKPPVKQVEQITCREFVAIDDEFKPQVVSYALGYDHAKRPDAAVIDVSGVEKAVPVVVSSCRARPTETLLQRVRAAFHRL